MEITDEFKQTVTGLTDGHMLPVSNVTSETMQSVPGVTSQSVLQTPSTCEHLQPETFMVSNVESVETASAGQAPTLTVPSGFLETWTELPDSTATQALHRSKMPTHSEQRKQRCYGTGNCYRYIIYYRQACQ